MRFGGGNVNIPFIMYVFLFSSRVAPSATMLIFQSAKQGLVHHLCKQFRDRMKLDIVQQDDGMVHKSWVVGRVESVFPRITLQATMEDWDPLLHTLGL